MTKTVLILGASGKIGNHCARAFHADGWTVRKFNRKTDDMTEVAMGADVIVNGLNPPNYHDWARLIPQITRDVIKAAKASGATVIIPGNVYNFGNATGPWSENTSQNPHTRKGKIRVEMEAEYRRSNVQTIILRAGDFIDPDRGGAVMDMLFLKSIAKGKIQRLGKTDVHHAYCFLPDFARAAADLANIRQTLDVFTDIPFANQNFSMEELKTMLENHFGRPLQFTMFPWWLMTATKPFWELAHELIEMRYLWDMPHQMSPTKLKQILPNFKPTPMAKAVISTLA